MGAVDVARVAEHIVELLAQVLVVLDRCVAAGRGNVEVIAHLTRRRVDVDEIAAAALYDTGAALMLMEEIALGVGTNYRTSESDRVAAM